MAEGKILDLVAVPFSMLPSKVAGVGAAATMLVESDEVVELCTAPELASAPSSSVALLVVFVAESVASAEDSGAAVVKSKPCATYPPRSIEGNTVTDEAGVDRPCHVALVLLVWMLDPKDCAPTYGTSMSTARAGRNRRGRGVQRPDCTMAVVESAS